MRGKAPERVDFNEYAASYQEDLQNSISFSGADIELFSEIKAELMVDVAGRRVGASEKLDVLDVGCGVGETAAFLNGRFANFYGVDIAEESVALAAAEHPWATYRHYEEGDPLPFDPESFDLAYTLCVVHHVPLDQRPGLIEDMKRVVRPGGIVVVFEHNPFNPLTRLAVSRCAFDADAVLISRRRTTRLLADAGLEPVESPYVVFFPRRGDRLRAIERRLGWLPLGAQYYVAARKPG